MAFYDLQYQRGRLAVPREVDIDQAIALDACQRLLGARIDASAILWLELRALASDISWWDREDHFVFLVGDWHNRQRLEIPTTSLNAGSLDGLVNLSSEARLSLAQVAVALAFAWDDPTERTRLEPGRWRRSLSGLSVSHRVEGVGDDDRPGGTLQVELLDPRAADDATKPLDGALTLQLIQLSKRSGKPLKPRKAPKSLAVADRKMRLPEGDRRALRLAEQRQLMGHIRTYRYGDSVTVDAEVSRLDAELFEALAEVSVVLFRGKPLTLGGPVWRPCLRILDGEQGLKLRWLERPVALYPTGFVIDAEHALRRLAPDLPPMVLHLLTDETPLPAIPAGEIDAFVEDFVLSAGVPVRIEARSLQASRSRPVPRLLLTEHGTGLQIEARFGYGDAQVDPAAAVHVIQADERLVQRDRAAEAEALAQLDDHLPSAPPVRLEGDAVFDFMLDALPALPDWTVFFDDAARAKRPNGTIRAQTSLQSGVDWFDLQVDFQVGGKKISQREVLRAWAEGHRYVQLGDGGVARLPGEWLKRHGAALAELNELRSATDGKLGAFAAPLAARLLDEVPPDLARRWASIAEKVQRFDRVADRPVPKTVKATLRDYQHRGFRWLCTL
ncbi:MAG: hypothetical protein ACI9U2_002931, partial [Bradymonadia bacterium]